MVLIVSASSQFASHSLVRASIKCGHIEKNLGPSSEYSTPASSATFLNDTGLRNKLSLVNYNVQNFADKKDLLFS